MRLEAATRHPRGGGVRGAAPRSNGGATATALQEETGGVRPDARRARPGPQRARRGAQRRRADARALGGVHHTATTARDQAVSGIGPTLPYSVKAAMTLARSARLARAHARPSRPERAAHPPLPPGGRRRATRSRSRRRRFREQMAYLAAEGYRGVDLFPALESLERGESDDARSASRSTTASRTWPSRRCRSSERHGFCATVFVTTGVTDGRVRVPLVRAASRRCSGGRTSSRSTERGPCASRRTPCRIRA